MLRQSTPGALSSLCDRILLAGSVSRGSFSVPSVPVEDIGIPDASGHLAKDFDVLMKSVRPQKELHSAVLFVHTVICQRTELHAVKFNLPLQFLIL